MLRKDTGSVRSRSRSAEGKSVLGGPRISRSNAVTIATPPNDVRCVAPRTDTLRGNDARRGLSLFAGGKNGVIALRSALSCAPNSLASLPADSQGGGGAASYIAALFGGGGPVSLGGFGSGSSSNTGGVWGGIPMKTSKGKNDTPASPKSPTPTTSGSAAYSLLPSGIQKATTAPEAIKRKQGIHVTCLCLADGSGGPYLWCGSADGSVQVFAASRKGGGAFHGDHVPVTNNMKRPEYLAGSNTLLQHATSSALLFEAHRHKGPVLCISAAPLSGGDGGGTTAAAAAAGIFTGGTDWQILRWSSDPPFTPLGCVGSHSLAVRCLLVAPKSLVSGGDDGVIKYFPYITAGDRSGQLIGHTDAVLCLTTRGNTLWSGAADATIRLWSLEGTRQCIHTLTTHRSPVISLQQHGDTLMMSFDKAGNCIVWDLQRAHSVESGGAGGPEALHCYQALGGIQFSASGASQKDGGSSAAFGSSASVTSRGSRGSPRQGFDNASDCGSVGSGGREPSISFKGVTSADSASEAGSVASRGKQQKDSGNSAKTNPALTVHGVQLVANVHGFIAWIFTHEGARLSFLPYRPIEDELEVKYGPALDDGGGEFGHGASSAAMEELKHTIEEHEARAQRHEEFLEEMQEEFAEFSDLLFADLNDILEDSVELYSETANRMADLYAQSVAAVQTQNIKKAKNADLRYRELEQKMDELNEKLVEKGRQLSQANAKSAQSLSQKMEENSKLSIDLQKSINELKQLQFELKAQKETIQTLEGALKKHEGKLGKAAKSEVELTQVKAELKMTKEALQKMHTETEKQSHEMALQRARLMGEDTSKAAILQELEAKLVELSETNNKQSHEMRELAGKYAAAKVLNVELEAQLAQYTAKDASHQNASNVLQQIKASENTTTVASAVTAAEQSAQFDQRLREAKAEAEKWRKQAEAKASGDAGTIEDLRDKLRQSENRVATLQHLLEMERSDKNKLSSQGEKQVDRSGPPSSSGRETPQKEESVRVKHIIHMVERHSSSPTSPVCDSLRDIPEEVSNSAESTPPTFQKLKQQLAEKTAAYDALQADSKKRVFVLEKLVADLKVKMERRRSIRKKQGENVTPPESDLDFASAWKMVSDADTEKTKKLQDENSRLSQQLEEKIGALEEANTNLALKDSEISGLRKRIQQLQEMLDRFKSLLQKKTEAYDRDRMLALLSGQTVGTEGKDGTDHLTQVEQELFIMEGETAANEEQGKSQNSREQGENREDSINKPVPTRRLNVEGWGRQSSSQLRGGPLAALDEAGRVLHAAGISVPSAVRSAVGDLWDTPDMSYADMDDEDRRLEELLAYIDTVKQRLVQLEASVALAPNAILRDRMLLEIQNLHDALLTAHAQKESGSTSLLDDAKFGLQATSLRSPARHRYPHYTPTPNRSQQRGLSPSAIREFDMSLGRPYLGGIGPEDPAMRGAARVSSTSPRLRK